MSYTWTDDSSLLPRELFLANIDHAHDVEILPTCLHGTSDKGCNMSYKRVGIGSKWLNLTRAGPRSSYGGPHVGHSHGI